MMRTLQIAVEHELSTEEHDALETRLERKLGPVHCVRHFSAIDGVRVQRDAQSAMVTIIACCELSERRARTLVGDLLKIFRRERA